MPTPNYEIIRGNPDRILFNQEIFRVLDLEHHRSAMIHYQLISYAKKFRQVELVEKEVFEELCDFIADVFDEIVSPMVKLEDVENYDCSLTLTEDKDDYEPQENYLMGMSQFYDHIVANIDCGVYVERIIQHLEPDSTD